MSLENIDTKVNTAPGREHPRFRKTAAIYLIVVMVATDIIVLVFYLVRNSITISLIPDLSQLIIFLLLGVISSRYLSKACDHSFPFLRELRWQLTTVGSLIMALVLITTYRLIDLGGWELIAGSVSAFMIPVAITEAWHSLIALPGLKVTTWVYQETIADNIKSKFKKTKDIRFRVVKRTFPYVTAPELTIIKGSEYSTLDSLFYELTMNLNKDSVVLQCYDDDGTPYSWAFCVRDKILGRRWLDPAASLMRNRITNREIIIAKRTKTIL